MIIWTIIPQEAIWPGDSSSLTEYEQVEYHGVQVLVEDIGGGQCRIARILTTNPADYLRTDLQPGAILNKKTTFEAL